MEQRRNLAHTKLLRYLRANSVPSLKRVGLCIESIQRPVPHLHAFWIDLFAFIDKSQGIVPPISDVFAIGLRLPCSCEPELFVSSCLPIDECANQV